MNCAKCGKPIDKSKPYCQIETRKTFIRIYPNGFASNPPTITVDDYHRECI